MAVVLLLSTAYAPANHNGNNNSTTASVQQNPAPSASVTSETAKTKPRTKEVNTKPRAKSLFDTEVLDSPLNYLRNAFTSEEEESDTASSNSAVVITVKALIATLLSTIM